MAMVRYSRFGSNLLSLKPMVAQELNHSYHCNIPDRELAKPCKLAIFIDTSPAHEKKTKKITSSRVFTGGKNSFSFQTQKFTYRIRFRGNPQHIEHNSIKALHPWNFGRF